MQHLRSIFRPEMFDKNTLWTALGSTREKKQNINTLHCIQEKFSPYSCECNINMYSRVDRGILRVLKRRARTAQNNQRGGNKQTPMQGDMRYGSPESPFPVPPGYRNGCDIDSGRKQSGSTGMYHAISPYVGGGLISRDLFLARSTNQGKVYGKNA